MDAIDPVQTNETMDAVRTMNAMDAMVATDVGDAVDGTPRTPQMLGTPWNALDAIETPRGRHGREARRHEEFYQNSWPSQITKGKRVKIMGHVAWTIRTTRHY